MRRSLAAALLPLALAGCGPSLLATDWDPTVHEGACEVRITRRDVAGSREEVRTYDAQGRPLSTRFHLTYDAPSFEHRRYDDEGRLVEIVLNEERAPVVGDCDVEGGCSSPARRTVTRTRVEHDAAGRPVRISTRRETYERVGGDYRPRQSEAYVVEHAYDADGRLVEIRQRNGTVRLEREGERVARLVRELDGRRHVVELRYDERGHLAAAEPRHCPSPERCTPMASTRFVHDARGRLTRIEHVDPDDGYAELYDEHTYDDADRVVATAHVEVRAHTGARTRDETVFTYDAEGRPRSSATSGGRSSDFGYRGSCVPESILPALRPSPSALRLAGAVACVPSHAGEVCFEPNE